MQRFSVRSAEGNVKLLKIIKNPVTDHLPIGCRKIGASYDSTNLVKPTELVPDDDKPLVIVVGAMAHGKVRERERGGGG